MTTTTEAKPSDVEKQALIVAKQAQAVSIRTPEDYVIACTQACQVAGATKRVEEFFKPMKAAAHKAWRTVCDSENKVLTPLQTAKSHLAFLIGRYQQEQEAERKRLEQTTRAQLRTQQEDKLLDRAQELEQEGRAEEADALLDQPVQTPVVVAPSVVPQVKGVSVREKWKFRITNEAKVPREYLMVDERKVQKVVDAMKSLTSILGIEVYEESKAVFRAGV